MMRVRQASLRSDCKPTQHEHHRRQQNRQYLQPDVHFYGHPPVSPIKANDDDRQGDNQEKGDCGHHTMGANE